jgi:Mlc titration factor MtfA (ptsG expression regulator)
MFGSKRRRRERLRRTPLTSAAWRTLDANVPYVATLPPPDRAELEGLVQIFLAEKRFEGCGGLAVSEEMKLTIAAQACLLLLRRDADVYPGLDSILLYPHPYVAMARSVYGGIVTEGAVVRLGETWSQGSLVLSWDDVLRGAADPHDGHNVVLHEFAHQLDQQDGGADGTPILPSRARHVAWARVLGAAYQDLVERVHHHRPAVLDAYGATNPAEFFAVATECFFEKPAALERWTPALYDELRRFYRRDPAAAARGEAERESPPV